VLLFNDPVLIPNKSLSRPKHSMNEVAEPEEEEEEVLIPMVM
jgi:hypothetical protein